MQRPQLGVCSAGLGNHREASMVKAELARRERVHVGKEHGGQIIQCFEGH